MRPDEFEGRLRRALLLGWLLGAALAALLLTTTCDPRGHAGPPEEERMRMETNVGMTDAVLRLRDTALGVSRMLFVLSVEAEGDDEPLSSCYQVMGSALWDAARQLDAEGGEDGE